MTLDGEGRSTAGREVVRSIVVPNSVSERAQQFLGMDMFGGDVRRAVPNDVAGWRTLIKETDELLVAVMGEQVEHLHDSVAPRSVNGVPVFVVTPEGVGEGGDTLPIYLDIHGGSLLMGGGKACEVMARRAAAQVQMQTWSVDYRMPPDHPYPAALDDVLAVYRGLLRCSGSRADRGWWGFGRRQPGRCADIAGAGRGTAPPERTDPIDARS